MKILDKIFGLYPGRTLNRIGCFLLGIWLASLTIGIAWPINKIESLKKYYLDKKVKIFPSPDRPITVLIIIKTKDIAIPKNIEFSSKMNQIESILLVKISKDESLEVLQLPIELAISLPEDKTIRSLSEVCSDKGVAICADISSEILGRKDQIADEYIIISNQAMDSLLELLSPLEVTLENSIRLKNNTVDKFYNIPKGTNILSATTIKKIIQYENSNSKEEINRQRLESIFRGIEKKFSNTEGKKRLMNSIVEILKRENTSLIELEIFSLLSSSIFNENKALYKELPLKKSDPNEYLREIRKEFKYSLW